MPSSAQPPRYAGGAGCWPPPRRPDTGRWPPPRRPPASTGHQNVDYRLTEGCGHVGGAGVRMLAHGGDHRCLQSAEGEVVAVTGQRAGEGEGGGVTVVGHSVDGRTARVAETEVAGHLVEGFAGGVVDGAAQKPIVAGLGHPDQEGVPPRYQEHHHRPAQIGLFEQRGEEVRLEVVDPDQGDVPGQSQGLGPATPTSSEPMRPGPRVTATASMPPRARIRPSPGRRPAPGSAARRGPDRPVRDHPAVAGVQVDLTAHHRGDDGRTVIDNGCRRLVARSLDAEDPVDRQVAPVGGMAMAGTLVHQVGTTVLPAPVLPARPSP